MISSVYDGVNFLGFTLEEAQEIAPQIPKELGDGHVMVRVGGKEFYVYVIIKCCRIVEQAKDSAKNPIRTAEKEKIRFFQNWLPRYKKP